jgi:hypothetical protein
MTIPKLLRKILLIDLLQGHEGHLSLSGPAEIYTEQYPLERRRWQSVIGERQD